MTGAQCPILNTDCSFCTITDATTSLVKRCLIGKVVVNDGVKEVHNSILNNLFECPSQTMRERVSLRNYRDNEIRRRGVDEP